MLKPVEMPPKVTTLYEAHHERVIAGLRKLADALEQEGEHPGLYAFVSTFDGNGLYTFESLAEGDHARLLGALELAKASVMYDYCNGGSDE